MYKVHQLNELMNLSSIARRLGSGLLYHNLLDCDPNPQTNSSRYLCQIAR